MLFRSISFEIYEEVKNNKEKYEDWYVGLVGFCATFGAMYFSAYARGRKNDNSGKKSADAIKNFKKTSTFIKRYRI